MQPGAWMGYSNQGGASTSVAMASGPRGEARDAQSKESTGELSSLSCHKNSCSDDELVRGLGNRSYKEQLRESRLFSLEQKETQGRL